MFLADTPQIINNRAGKQIRIDHELQMRCPYTKNFRCLDLIFMMLQYFIFQQDVKQPSSVGGERTND